MTTSAPFLRFVQLIHDFRRDNNRLPLAVRLGNKAWQDMQATEEFVQYNTAWTGTLSGVKLERDSDLDDDAMELDTRFD